MVCKPSKDGNLFSICGLLGDLFRALRGKRYSVVNICLACLEAVMLDAVVMLRNGFKISFADIADILVIRAVDLTALCLTPGAE